MSHSFDFGPLVSRHDLAAATKRILAPLVPYFTKAGSGIRCGMLAGAHGEPTASLEAFSRALWGLVPLLAGGGDFPEAGRWRDGIVAGTDPDHPGYWGNLVNCDQRQVEQPAIALALALRPDIFWEPLGAAERARVSTWLFQTNEVDIVDSNWRWFRVLVNAALRSLGENWSPERMEEDFLRIDEFHLGGGWYRDENRIGDYYIPMAMQYYGLLYAKLAEDSDLARSRIYKERAGLLTKDFVAWFAASGEAVPFGRSLIYRMAQGAFWGALAFADVEALPWGEIKGLLLRHLRWWLAQPIFTETGLLTVGYRFSNPSMGESYNAYGSPYWALKALLPLALPEGHPFWRAEEMAAPVRAAVSIQPLAGMALCHDETSGHVFGLNQGQPLEGWPRHCAHKYGKLAYSATFGFGVAAGNNAARAGLDGTLALSDDGGLNFRLREKCESQSLENGVLASTWTPWPDVEVRTWLVPALPGHLRIHRIRSKRALRSADGGFSIDRQAKGYQELPCSAVVNEAMGSAMIDLHGGRRVEVITHEPGFHLMWFSAAFPVLMGDHSPGETWLATYATGWPGVWTSETLASE
ncbi:DUF2264 domain-containing protein, partial [bacterium]|nr:DUF2264 domain-containing protein [bacterium]